jgi:hypothetical protein
MTSFTFSAEYPRFFDYTSQFSIKVSNDQASFVIKDKIVIHVPEDTLGSSYYLDQEYPWQSPQTRNIERIDKVWFDRIMSDKYLSDVDIVKGTMCNVDFMVTDEQITLGGITVPAHRETRQSFVDLLKYFNNSLDELDSMRALNLLQWYILCAYKKEQSLPNEENSKYLNDFFRSGSASDQFKTSYVEALLKYGSI